MFAFFFNVLHVIFPMLTPVCYLCLFAFYNFLFYFEGSAHPVITFMCITFVRLSVQLPPLSWCFYIHV